MIDLNCLLFLHIPKTAGTSFRQGAVRALGARHCHFDYGRRSKETSALVRKYAHENPDIFRLGKELARAKAKLLGGHFGYRRFGPLFKAGRVFAFCRNPEYQLMSHYSHWVRHNDYADSLSEFLGGRAGAGMQTRVFDGMPLEAFGFIGVTERYEDSLRVVRNLYEIEIEPLMHNVNPNRESDQPYPVPDDMNDMYQKAVAQDMGVYERANALLDARLAALDAGYAYVHGAIQNFSQTRIQGFAFDNGNRPVTVELEVNGRTLMSSKATSDRGGLRMMNVARNGYVGFDFRKDNLLQPGDNAVVKVASTGQVLGSRVVSVAREVAA